MENKNGAKANKRKTGSRYEDIVARFLSLKGYTVLERNYRVRTAEIDIIARDADTLAFVEVKYRKDLSYGYPSEAVNRHKRLKITEAARYYIADRHLYNTKLRFDVVEIAGNKIRIIKDAFNA